MVCSWGRYSNQKETRMRETVPFSYSYFLKLITMMFTLIFTKENNCGNLTIVCFDLVKILSTKKETRMRETVPFSYSYFLKLITMMFTLIFTKENNCGNLTIVCFDLVKILLSAFMLSLLSL